MDQLPADLVRAIAKVIDREDILSFRLTCRSFAALGLPRQFEVIPLMLLRESLENLRRISENALYRNYVLAIEYGPSIVMRPRDLPTWSHYVKELRSRGDSFERFSRSEVEQAYQTHVRYYDDQEHIKATGYDFKALQSAVSGFPNLRGLRIMWADQRNKLRNPPAAWGDAFCNMANVMGGANVFLDSRNRIYTREITAGLVACKLAPRALSRFECENFELRTLTHYDENENERDYGDEFIGARAQLSRFKNFVRNPTMDLGFPLMCATFESLTYVKLIISHDPFKGDEDCQKRLGTALHGAQGLETLFIQANNVHYDRGEYPVSFNPLFGSYIWPHLKDLSLSGFIVHEHDLPSLFARHPSIHTFALGSAYAADFDWATLLQSESLAPRWRQLRSLTLDGHWGARNWSTPLHELNTDSYIGGDEELDDEICLFNGFGQWAQDIVGAYSLRGLLECYYSSEIGEAPFPLRTSQENAVAEVPNGSHNMIIAAERLVGEQYRYRNLYAEYLEDEEAVQNYGSDSEVSDESMSADGPEGEEETENGESESDSSNSSDVSMAVDGSEGEARV